MYESEESVLMSIESEHKQELQEYCQNYTKIEDNSESSYNVI